jgi:hypothetical protein
VAACCTAGQFVNRRIPLIHLRSDFHGNQTASCKEGPSRAGSRSSIRRDDNDTRAFYLRTATAKEIHDGAVTSAQAGALTQALPTAK